MQGLDCNTCEGTDTQRLRGCTSPPRVPDWHRDEYRGWADFTHRYFVEQCTDRQVVIDDTAAERFYPLGGLACSVAVLGRPWERCPRSYLRPDLDGYDARAHWQAGRAVELWATSKSMGLQATTRLPLIPVMVDLVNLCERAQGAHTAARLEAMKTGTPPPGSSTVGVVHA